ncbi:UNVERIFIED_CONTAM: hypothetical protein PYX00_008095 [Menopon gallinae]|uniref:Pentatricopeptide repeat-containing protein n=1 Tax=Menopon gallinae TaxID=328185 RepID=A0AAW2HLW8_9NEOP
MAYCRHGIISEPLILIEKLQKRGFKFDTQCFNYLLEACCRDRSSGFRYALLIWRYMRTHSIVPNSYTFLAIAKCAEQCCLGDVELIPEFLKSIAQETGDFSKLLLAKKSSNLTINVNDESKSLGGAEEEIKTELPNGSNGDIEFNVNDTNEKGLNSLALASGSGEESLFLNEIETNMPINIEKKKYDGEYINLLSDKPVCGAITGCDFSNRENRFLLLGGMKGFLKVMADFNVKPNRQIFTKLLTLMSGTRDVENIILQLMKQYKVKPDTVFMNVLVRKRIYCRDICSLEEYIDLYKRYRLNPSIFTISILALTCRDYESGKKCVAYAKENDIRLNSEALTPLLKNAIRSNDLKYMSLIVNVAKEHDVEASPLFMATLREAAQKAQQLKFRTMAVEETARISESEK